jgi:aspartate/methionine/tyrosine aminotransferase
MVTGPIRIALRKFSILSMARSNWVFSLSEIRAGLSEAAPNFPSREALVKALRSKLDHIDQHINEVRARRRQIVKLLKEMGD